MLFRGILLEGVACSGKSTVLGALLRHPRLVGRSGSSMLVLTEHHTQRVLEALGPKAALGKRDNVELLEQHTRYLSGIERRLDSMSRWREADAPNARFVAIVERFHFTHVLNYRHVAWEDVADLDAQLAATGLSLCLLVASRQALSDRLKTTRPEQWGSFLLEEGQRNRLTPPLTPESVAAYFASQQEALLELASKSRMPCIHLDTSSTSVDDCARKLVDHLA